MPEPTVVTPAVAIVGGGPAGLSVAARLAPRLPGQVLVLDREKDAGGIPRHADHPGYGIRDRKAFMTGPAYARALVREAQQAGAVIRTRTQVTGWADQDVLEATTPRGRMLVRPDAFVFATGARERPRTARRIPGGRPPGVLTTGQLQNLVHLHHRKVGTRAVVVGAELVSWSAVMTLREAGCRTEALISAYPRGESYTVFKLGGGLAFRTRVVTSSRVVVVHGKRRVTGVEIEDTRTGSRRTIECNTLVFTGDWIPDNELLRMRGIELDPAAGRAPVTDQTMRTSVGNIFSVGNVNHPVETADVVALEGRYAADRLLAHLTGARTGGEELTVRAAASAASSLTAPETVMAMSWVAPSASATRRRPSRLITSVSASSSSSWEGVVPEAPEASRTTVSLVDMHPSELIRLTVRIVAEVRASWAC